MGQGEGRSLAETPTWAVATVVSVMVALGFFFHGSLKQFGKCLHRTKRKALLSALEKIKEELMLFGLLSLLMGHWTVYVAKICVKSSALSSRFYPCLPGTNQLRVAVSLGHFPISSPNYVNYTVVHEQVNNMKSHFCPEVHRFLFVLGITHVSYSFFAIALAMIKIYSWKTWEDQAKSMAPQELQGSPQAASNSKRIRRLSTFISHHTSHRWSQHEVLVWLLCFSRQFWSSITRADYMALRLGFITTHQLPLSYDFHNYMLRSIEEEFHDIVGIRIVSLFWCSFIMFPLYVIITQMGSRFKKSIVSENVRRSIHGWRRRVKAKHGDPSFTLLRESSSALPLDSTLDVIERSDTRASRSMDESASRREDTSDSIQHGPTLQDQTREISEKLEVSLCIVPPHFSGYDEDNDSQSRPSDAKESSHLLPLP